MPVSHIRKPNELVTVYYVDGFGSIGKLEGKLVELQDQVKYAQYDNAVRYLMIPKGKRKPQGFILGYRPWLVVVAGHGHPDPDHMLDEKSIVNGVELRQSRYASFDEAYRTDFIRDVLPTIPESAIIYKRFN